MNPKKYLYAAVGAQVAVAKSAQSKLEELMTKLNENASTASEDVRGRIDVWAGEGEKFLSQVTDTKAIDDITSKVDFDQMQTQVHKLRDQLEDIMSTWRANFRPESKPAATVTVSDVAPTVPATATEQPTAKKPAAATAAAAKTTAAKTTAAKTTAAKKPAAQKPAAKKPAAKKPAAKKPAAKTTATRTTAAKKPAASKAS